MKRNETRSVQVDKLTIGGQNRVIMQSMCNTRTKHVKETVAQILALEQVGCELVRLAVIDMEDADAI